MYKMNWVRPLAGKALFAVLIFMITAGMVLPVSATTGSAGDDRAADAVGSVQLQAPVIANVDVEAENEPVAEVLDELDANDGVVLFAADELDVQAASKDSVVLSYDRVIRHESWFTRNFTVQYDGKTKTAYCIEPEEYPPGQGPQTAVKYDNELMTKALYYSYGYPGFEAVTKGYLAGRSIHEDYRGNDGAYALSHLLLSYLYDGGSGSTDAFKGISASTKTLISDMANTLKNEWPAVPENAVLEFSCDNVAAVWNKDKQIQETPVIKLIGHKDNVISVKVPQGASMIKITENELTEYASGTVGVKGGDEFYFTAPASVEGKYESGKMTGSLQEFQSYMIQVSGKQDIMYCGDGAGDSVSFTIEWENIGEFVLDKESASPEITDNNPEYSLEGAGYEIKDESGEVYAELITDAEGKAELLLPYGEYTLKEISAPKGYAVDENLHDISITEDETAFEHKEQIAPNPNGMDDSPETGDDSSLPWGIAVIALFVITILLLQSKSKMIE